MILQYFDFCMFDTLSDVLPFNYLFAADPEHQRKEICGSSSDNLVILYHVCCVIWHPCLVVDIRSCLFTFCARSRFVSARTSELVNL